jgi:hypothetical protein
VTRRRRRKPFKLSRLPKPKGPSDTPHMREPTIPELRELRAQLRDHADKPLPPELRAYLDGLISWAGWKITRPSTPHQTQYQRYRIVLEGYQLAVRQGLKSGKTGLWKFAFNYAVEMLAGSYAECRFDMMRKSYEAERDATYE